MIGANCQCNSSITIRPFHQLLVSIFSLLFRVLLEKYKLLFLMTYSHDQASLHFLMLRHYHVDVLLVFGSQFERVILRASSKAVWFSSSNACVLLYLIDIMSMVISYQRFCKIMVKGILVNNVTINIKTVNSVPIYFIIISSF